MRGWRIPLLLLATGGLALLPAAAATTARRPTGANRSGAPTRTPAAPTAKPRTSAAARAVAVAIRARTSGPVQRFYADRGYWPLWAPDGKIGPEAEMIVNVLETADRDGLKPDAYGTPALRAALKEAKAGGPEAVAAAELALSRIFARYVADVRRPPRVGMAYLDSALKPRRLSATDVLVDTARVTDLSAYVTRMGWMSPHYVRLRAALARNAPALSPSERQRLRLNLDRARLLPGPWTRHIVVDAASARLFFYEGGRQQGVMRVVAGTPETPTPMLAGFVRYAILNPYWNVPTDLTARRVAPKVLAGATLASLRYEALSGWGADAAPLDPATIDWQAVASGKRELRLRQLPGGNNAMGRVKFMFPNDQGIYLHDTPDKSLMAKPARHFSNGCVRLEDAPRLSRWLLGKPLTAWPKRAEQDVALADPVPVFLTYLTATPTDAGIGFLADPYDRDKR